MVLETRRHAQRNWDWCYSCCRCLRRHRHRVRPCAHLTWQLPLSMLVARQEVRSRGTKLVPRYRKSYSISRVQYAVYTLISIRAVRHIFVYDPAKARRAPAPGGGGRARGSRGGERDVPRLGMSGWSGLPAKKALKRHTVSTVIHKVRSTVSDHNAIYIYMR